ncbi:50S ribosomal protein L6 [Pseudofulvimonas gallinarii]|uniref:Large ribosomal subunit protein uL6 n=1 Tax=Pseudofulvimonas gallinarii TaxID=634155 RepID=A0A4R3LL63_9GAMM|nr:50S ribosomal protein L6 [Pseudofulvimonas gallinarii]TCS98526.1 LSU ribosomal protein L6P [Pseudofulvimonas gallinarii]THD13679.1 50S ribosomal protein L6 [Pseudofulvimonas gallinarii]
MSRVAKKPIALPKGVELSVNDQQIQVKGPKGTLNGPRPAGVDVNIENGTVQIAVKSEQDWAMAGTLRALLNNMVTGVSQGFERKLELVGVGYRASMQGRDLNLSLGFSHPVVFKSPEGITIETPTQTEILVKGSDKQAVGQVAAKIRAYRPPEPYKGKGVRYSGEKIVMKEAKKA